MPLDAQAAAEHSARPEDEALRELAEAFELHLLNLRLHLRRAQLAGRPAPDGVGELVTDLEAALGRVVVLEAALVRGATEQRDRAAASAPTARTQD